MTPVGFATILAGILSGAAFTDAYQGKSLTRAAVLTAIAAVINLGLVTLWLMLLFRL